MLIKVVLVRTISFCINGFNHKRGDGLHCSPHLTSSPQLLFRDKLLMVYAIVCMCNYSTSQPLAFWCWLIFFKNGVLKNLFKQVCVPGIMPGVRDDRCNFFTDGAYVLMGVLSSMQVDGNKVLTVRQL